MPVVSAGLLSPLPTAEDNTTRDNTTSLIESWIDSPTTGGWHWNLQNNIWNTNYPQWFREFSGVFRLTVCRDLTVNRCCEQRSTMRTRRSCRASCCV